MHSPWSRAAVQCHSSRGLHKLCNMQPHVFVQVELRRGARQLPVHTVMTRLDPRVS